MLLRFHGRAEPAPRRACPGGSTASALVAQTAEPAPRRACPGGSTASAIVAQTAEPAPRRACPGGSNASALPPTKPAPRRGLFRARNRFVVQKHWLRRGESGGGLFRGGNRFVVQKHWLRRGEPGGGLFRARNRFVVQKHWLRRGEPGGGLFRARNRFVVRKHWLRRGEPGGGLFRGRNRFVVRKHWLRRAKPGGGLFRGNEQVRSAEALAPPGRARRGPPQGGGRALGRRETGEPLAQSPAWRSRSCPHLTTLNTPPPGGRPNTRPPGLFRWNRVHPQNAAMKGGHHGACPRGAISGVSDVRGRVGEATSRQN